MKKEPEKRTSVNLVRGDSGFCGLQAARNYLRLQLSQTNLFTNMGTFDEFLELEHRRSHMVKIILPVARAFGYLPQAKSHQPE